jgi:hypothetical protein
MNSDTSTPASEAAKTRLVVALEWLFKQDNQWRPVPSEDGATITLTRRWTDATADTIAMSPDTTYAVRTDPQGQQAERVTGTAMRVTATVRLWRHPVPSQSSTPEGTRRVQALSGLWA